jgi:GWxTD domain-containing protein
MMSRIKLPLILIIIAVFLTQACGKKEKLSETDFSEIYGIDSDDPSPRFVVYHSNDEETEVHFMVHNRTLTYGLSPTGLEEAQIKVKWELYKGFESKEVIDSSTFEMIDTIAFKGSNQLSGDFKINATYPNSYLLKVVLIDMIKKEEIVSFVEIDKRNKNNRQNFKVTLKSTGALLFREYLYPGEEVLIEYKKDRHSGPLYNHHFSMIFPIAPPPFALNQKVKFNYDNHTLSELINQGSGVFSFTPGDNGFYHITPSNETKHGWTVYAFGEDYPEINTPEEMLSAMRFVLTKKEYNALKNTPELRKNLERFWLKAGQNPDRARELIKLYYSRVENANYYFTSYKEGWKTDRGIIYIVFGPPDVVYRSGNGETWIYGEEKNYRSTNFNFNKVINPFTNNDYELVRSTIYKNPWYRSVDAWRQGRISSKDA